MATELGDEIAAARTRLALSQEELATQLDVKQQSVSRWEKGLSRPRGATLARLASALSLTLAELKRPERLDQTQAAAPAVADDALPVRPLTDSLPFLALTPEDFERFVADLLARRFPDSEVTPLGARGDDQRGFDILLVRQSGQRAGVQCKREHMFGPAKVRKAISVAELSVDEGIIALARRATAAARFEIDAHASWTMWDQADLSRHVRELSVNDQLQLVRSYFPHHVESFVGIPTAGPWMTPQEFYRDAPQVLLNHRQPLVGREETVTDMTRWATEERGPNLALLVGRGGLGKSKLLWEITSRQYGPEVHFRFLALDHAPTPVDFDSLPRTGQLVVVIDDAHNVERIAGLATQLWNQRPDAKLLLATRPSGEPAIENEVSRLGQSLRYSSRWVLEDLSVDDGRQLVSQLVNRPVYDPLVGQLAAISLDCPFIAVVAADLLRRDELATSAFASSATLRTEVLRRYSELTPTLRGGVGAAVLKDVLCAVAAFQPVRLNDVDFETAITRLMRGPSWDEVNGRVRELEDLGLLLRRNDAVRVVPDMLGDVLLGQAAYDDRAGRPTRFLQRAQEGARGAALQHLLVNATRMDWQVRDGQPARTDMVGQLWEILRTELLSGTYEQQVELLRLVAKLAFYQPAQSLEVVQSVLELEQDEHEGLERNGPAWNLTRLDVVRALSPVLRSIAYHLDFVPLAAELLWRLAQDDPRPTHQHPDHPLRVLTDMASLQTGKPLDYVEAVIDVASSWLLQHSAVSPFDVLEPVLAVEGNDEVHSVSALTFYSYPLSPDSVRGVRTRVIELAAAEARRPDVLSAVRGIRALEHATRGPLGRFGRAPSDDELAEWNREFLPTIALLGEIASEPAHDPAVRIAIRQALGWHAEYGPEITKEAAVAALAALATSFDDDLALCLHDGWGRLALRSGMSYEEAQQRQAEEFRRVARGLTADKSADAVLHELEGRLKIEREVFGGIGNSGRFLWEVFSVARPVAVRLCEASEINQYPESARYVAQALAALAASADEDVIAIASRLAASGISGLAATVAWSLSWGRGGRVGVLPGEDALLTELAVHPDASVRVHVGRAVYLIALSEKALALEVARKLHFRDSGKVAAELLASFAHGEPLNWSETDPGFRNEVLDQLSDCPSIDEYELLAALGELSRLEPLAVTRLLLNRLDLVARAGKEYDPLPFAWEPPLRVSDTSMLARCLLEVRDWMNSDQDSGVRHQFQDFGAQLYSVIAGGWSEQAIAVLADVEDMTSERELMTVARILAHAPPDVLFESSALITRLLRRAESLGHAEGQRVFRALLPTNYRLFTVWSGSPSPEDIRARDRAREVSNQLARRSIESRFFATLADAFDARQRLGGDLPDRPDWRDW